MKATYHVSVHKVPSHVGIPGNEYADRVAYTGNFSIGNTGRFAHSEDRSLRPPVCSWDLSSWEGKSLNEQNQHLRAAIEEAKKLIPFLPLQPHKPWISRNTLQLIADFRDSVGLSADEVKSTRNRIKAAARRDKKLFAKTQLSKDYESSPKQWTTIRKLRKEFKPRTPGIKDSEGKLMPQHRRADTIKKYLSEEVWRCSTPSQQALPSLYEEIPSMFRPFTEEELSACLKNLSTGRAAGPDTIPAELVRMAPYSVRVFLLSHYNKCLTQGAVPDAWLLSDVVMLIKDARKDPLSLDNHRAICLTDVFYKVYASLLQRRLAMYIDPRIRDNQFGFRRGRSTSQPIHVLRRLLEAHERQDSPLHLLFLDWSKAFDSVTFCSIEQSLVRIGVPPPSVKAIMAIYSSPRFRVRDSGITSEEGFQGRGVRQGCPLSPYLFNILLTCLFWDIERSYETKYGVLAGVLSAPSRLWDLEYADDTVLLSHSYVQLNRLLHLLQHHALFMGLRLNLGKCKHLAVNSPHRVHYAPDPNQVCQCEVCSGNIKLTTPVPKVDEVKYLGIFLDATGSDRRTVSARISKAVHASKLLKPFFSHRGLGSKWKLVIYRSVLLSILSYAMESCCIKPVDMQRVNKFHFQQMRRVFGLKSSYYHRVIHPSNIPCSNQYLAERANILVPTPTPSQHFSFQRLKLLGHVLRHPDSHEYTSAFCVIGCIQTC